MTPERHQAGAFRGRIQIALASDRDGDDEIYTMRPDGTDVRQLTVNDARDWFPAWSP